MHQQPTVQFVVDDVTGQCWRQRHVGGLAGVEDVLKETFPPGTDRFSDPNTPPLALISILISPVYETITPASARSRSSAARSTIT